MKLVQVSEHHKLGQDGLWDRIRAEVVTLLDRRRISFSSVDLARFAWVKANVPVSKDEGDKNEDKKDPASEEQPDYNELPHFNKWARVYTTPATIWIGVMPNTTTAEQAYHSSRDILDLLTQHKITGVEVAYRESKVTFSGGPALFAPRRSYSDPLKDVIDGLSSALSVPIARLRMDTQGTLGLYFKAGNHLYGVTARHVLFKNNEPNVEYNYVRGGEKKEVVVMGPSAFTAHLEFLQKAVRGHEINVEYLERCILSLTAQAEDIGSESDAEELKMALSKTQKQLTDTRTKMDVVAAHLEIVREKWGKLEDRVIGRVVWAPPIAAVPPHQYMQDVCVIKLNKEKFQGFKGNVLSLGPEIDPGKFVGLMCNNQYDAPREFEYPPSGLLELHDVLTEEDMRTTPPGESIRRVIKRAPSTLTTIGRLSAYASHVRRYYPTGPLDSVETAIHTDHPDSLPFSMRGDSGSVIVDARGRFVALLTGGAGVDEFTYGTPSCEITYGTPMHWLWPLIQAKFKGASLEFGSDELNI
ncbi:hypothetical protein VTO73DRAFT_15302 [Trametes versicolor]